MTGSFEGKVAVVTGAAGGIGLALVDALAAERAHVVMADLDPERLAAAAATVAHEPGTEVMTLPTDVSSYAAMQRLAAAVHDRFGVTDLLFNNAGVQRPGRIWKVTPEDFEWLLRVNLLGAFHGIRAFVPAMIERGQPAHVVNTASISGLLGFAQIGTYAATKFGIVGLSESLLHDLNERGAPVGVSVLCPGAVATGLAANSDAIRGAPDTGPAAPAQGRDPAEIAAAVLDAVMSNRFWILTHPGYAELLERRTESMLGRDRRPLVSPGFFD